MNSHAASAFIKAGNYQAALNLVGEALQKNNSDYDALNLLCEINFVQEKWKEVEIAATNLLGVCPGHFNAHGYLLQCYVKNNTKKMAEQLLAHFKTVAPHAATQQAVLQSMYDVKFGNKSKGFSGLAHYAASAMDQASEFKFNSLAVLAKHDLPEALIEAEFSFRSGDETAHNAQYISMLAYRLCKFQKCRKYASLALQKDRSLAVATELRYLSWLVCFPPFLFAHVVLLSISKSKKSVLSRIFFIAFGIIFFILIFLLLKFIMSLFGLTTVQTALLVSAFSFYQPYIGTLTALFKNRSAKPITLKDY